MSDKNTYQQEEQIRRYMQNEMTGAERNAFEREMQKDPFLADAVDGLSAFSTEAIISDIQSLKTKIQKGRRSDRKFIWYAAASILVIVISTFMLFNLEEKTNPVLTENIRKVESESPKEIIPEPQSMQQNETEQKTISISDSIDMEYELEIVNTEVEPISEENKNTKSAFTPDLAMQMKLKKSVAIAENRQMATTDSQQKVISQELINESVSTEEKPFVKTVSTKGKQRAVEATPAEEFAMPVTVEPATFMAVDQKTDTALEEVVAVGYGVQRKNDLTGSVSVKKIPERKNGKAIPSDGWEAYYKGYLNFELQHPDIGSPNIKVVVRLSFVVDETGKPGSFKIINSTNEKYNQTAIEIIKDGPGWWPAVKDSVAKSELVKMRLVFPPSK